MWRSSSTLVVNIKALIGWVFATCLPAWHALQSMSFSNFISSNPLTKSFFISFLSELTPTWASLLCHSHPSVVLVNRHVFKLASSEVKSTRYRLLYLKPLNITWPSFFDTTTSFLVNKHWKPRSHNWPTDNKLKLNEATYSTFDIEWAFDIVILSNPCTCPLNCHQK